jgi:hypothetical protein
LTLRTVKLPDGRIWLRVAQPDWTNPLDSSYAQNFGGRWNPPKSFATLYLNGDVITARLQIERMCGGTPITPDDLADDAYVLVAATLPAAQFGADAVSVEGLISLGLPQSYPLDGQGGSIPRAMCHEIGAGLQQQGIGGVWCRSHCTDDGRGKEFAWYSGTQNATAVWHDALQFGAWRYADTWHDIELAHQPDPA